MTQEEFNVLVRGIVFASSTDACMEHEDIIGAVDALKSFMKENKEFAENVDLGSIYIFGETEDKQCDPEVNKELVGIFGDKLPVRGLVSKYS